MPFLTILRHAKAAPPLPGQDDFDRPLTERGRSDAVRMAKALDGLGIDLALVSTAARTTETWDLVSAALTQPLPATAEDSLYLCCASHLIERVRAVTPDIRSVVIVGHNPSMEEAARWLAGKSKAPGGDQMREKFPTCGAAIFELTGGSWSDFAPKSVTFKQFTAPRLLD